MLLCIKDVTPIGANWKGYFYVFRGAISGLIKSAAMGERQKSAIRAKKGGAASPRTAQSELSLLISLNQRIFFKPICAITDY